MIKISEKLIHRLLINIYPININEIYKQELLKYLPSTYNNENLIIHIQSKKMNIIK